MPKLIPKYQNQGFGGIFGGAMASGVINNAPAILATIQNMNSNQTFNSTTATPPPLPPDTFNSPAPLPPEVASMQTSTPTYAPPDLDGALADVIGNSENPGSTSAIGGLLSIHRRNNPFGFKTGSESTSATGGFNFKNQAMGMAANYLGQSLGQQIGGKFGDEIGSIGSIVGQQLLTNGNLKGLFSGASGNALAGVGYNMLNKAMGGDKNKDFGSRMLTDLGGMAWSVNPVFGAAVTGAMVVNNLTGKSTQKYQGNSFQSQEMQADLGGSYGSSMIDLERAKNKAGHYGGIGRLTGEYKRANARVGTGNDTLTAMEDIYDRKKLGQIRGQNMADINSLDYRLNTFGGYDQYGTRIGRKGMKLPNKQDIDRIKNILEFKKGGQMNVIPEGALHARLHHMETGNKITRKGIPVVDKNGEQQAEIERNEIIFSLEVTNKLEELRKDGSDKAALEAGKLLVDEIFHNTDDRTGLIQEVIGQETTIFKEGGILAEKPTNESYIEIEKPSNIEEFEQGDIIAEMPDGSDDEEEIEEFQKGGIAKYPHWDESMMSKTKPGFEEWVKDVNPNFNSPNYDLKTAYEMYPFEELERWKWATNQQNPEYYLNYQDENGKYIYHLNSIAQMPNGEYMFLKKGTERTNPEIEGELAAYYNGENGLLDTHDLKFDHNTNRYYYRHKQKHQEGGIIEQLNKLSPDKLKELETILKYLNHD